MLIDLATLAPDTLALIAEVARKAAEQPAADETGCAFLDVLAEVMEREAALRATGHTMGNHPAVAEALEHAIHELTPDGLRLAMDHVLSLRDAQATAGALYRTLGLPALAESRAAAAEFVQALLLALDDERRGREEAFRQALERMAEAEDKEGTDDA